MRKPRSIKVSIKKSVFIYILDYFNITQWVKDQVGIDILDEKEENINTTIARLRKISEYIKLPVSTFFLSDPPNFPQLPKDFRSIGVSFTKNTINAFRQAYYYQDLLNELTNEKILIEKRFAIKDDPKTAANFITSLFNIENIRKGSNDPATYFRKLRRKLNQYNIYTFKESFPVEETRGFSIYEKNPPIIIINRKDLDQAKIFTLFHELGHILLEKPGISEPSSNEFKSNNPIEIWCNEFSARILIPENIRKTTTFDKGEDIAEKITMLSKRLHISKHSLVYTLFQEKQISLETYKEYISRPYSVRKDYKGEFKIPRRNIITSYKGKKFVNVIMDAYRENQLSQAEVRNILNINRNDKAFHELLIS